MSITIDDTSQGEITLDTSLTVSHTCSGAGRALYVAVTTYIDGSVGEVPTGVTYAGQAMEQLITQIYGQSSAERITLYRLVNPDTGANNIVVSTTSSQEIVLVGISLNGVDQINSDDTPTSEANPVSTQPSQDAISEPRDLILDFLGFYNDGAETLVEGASQTQRVYNNNTSVNECLACSSKPGEVSTTMSWTWSGYDQGGSGHVVINVNVLEFTTHKHKTLVF